MNTNNAMRSIFVIMPFVQSYTRNHNGLTQFFHVFLKQPIESHHGFMFKYHVTRSDNSFDIGTKIIDDLYDADIVICDLSGEQANPNVMYELGVRLAITNKPVILIRESHPNNEGIFDVAHYHTYSYDIQNHQPLIDYLVAKIKAFESGVEIFESPVLRGLRRNRSVISQIEMRRVKGILAGLQKSLWATLRCLAGSFRRHFDPSVLPQPQPDSTSAFIYYLVSETEQLRQLDWSRYHFSPTVPPQLLHLLSDTPLNIVFEDWIAEVFSQFLQDYYGKYFSTDLFWSTTDFDSILPYSIETHSLLEVIDCLPHLDDSPDGALSSDFFNNVKLAIKHLGFVEDETKARLLSILEANKLNYSSTEKYA